LSRIFQGADAAAATRISGLGALGGLSGGGSFAPRFGLDDPAFDAMPFGYSGNGLGGPEQALDIDAVREEAFARGFDEGAAASEAAMAELSARQDALTQALAALKAPASGTLAAMLSTAVVRLVEQIVGNAPIDADLLRRRCESVAACMEDNDGDVTLRVHPDDMPLLDGADMHCRLSPDPTLGRGSVRLDADDGWIEDGPDVRLSRLRATLDAMEGGA